MRFLGLSKEGLHLEIVKNVAVTIAGFARLSLYFEEGLLESGGSKPLKLNLQSGIWGCIREISLLD